MMISRCNDLADLEMLSECLKLEDLDLSHPKLRNLDLGLTPNLKWLSLKNSYDLVEINAPIGYLKKIAFLDLSCCGRFKSFVFGKWSQTAKAGSLHLITEPTDVFPVHSDNDSPKFQFSCYYKEDPASSFDLHDGNRVVELPEQIGSLEGLKELNIEENRGSELPSTLNIDYMGQFSSGDKTKQDARTNKAETSSSRKNSRKSKAQETLQGFMNPKVNTANKITKDAGKRRVQADGQATGHWFTDGDEKRLIDSDSDSDIPSISEVATKKTCDKSEPYLNRRKCVNEPRKLSESLDTSTGKDLWEDFRHEKRANSAMVTKLNCCTGLESLFPGSNMIKQASCGAVTYPFITTVTLGRVQSLDLLDHHSDFWAGKSPFPLSSSLKVQSLDPLDHHSDFGRFTLATFYKTWVDTFNRNLFEWHPGSVLLLTDSSSSWLTTGLVLVQSLDPLRSTTVTFGQNPRVNTAKGITKDAGKRRVQVDGQATGHWSIPTLLRSSLEAPSLLGFDDLPEPQITPALEETKQSNTSNRVPPVADDDDEFEIQTLTVAH
ncbi:hypothetical protein Tco_0731215 [Tanacetum coccineum]